MIGANLVRRLISEGCRPHLLLRPGGNRTRLLGLESNITIQEGDITNCASVVEAMNRSQATTVFHLASTPFNPADLPARLHLQVNVTGMFNILEALRKVPESRLIYTGTAAVYGEGTDLREDRPMSPTTIVGATKGAATMLMQTYSRVHGVNSVELRLFAPYGPWEHSRRLIPHVVLSALDRQDIPITEGIQQRDFVFIDDVVEALVLASNTNLTPGTVINIGSGVGTPVKDAAEMVLGLMGHPVKLLVGAVPTRPDEIMEMSADISTAHERLGWEPTVPMGVGLLRTRDWIQKNLEVMPQLV